MKIYFDFRDWWIGYYRGEEHHYICLLPSLVIRWNRPARLVNEFVDDRDVQCGFICDEQRIPRMCSFYLCGQVCDQGNVPHGAHFCSKDYARLHPSATDGVAQ